MNALGRFEQFVESVVEGSFTRLMRSQLQPVEIAKRLAKVAETGQIIAAGKTMIPNDFQVMLNVGDMRPFEPSKRLWEKELGEYLKSLASERGWSTFGEPVVSLNGSESVASHQVMVAARLIDHPAIKAAEHAKQDFECTQPIQTEVVRSLAKAPHGARLVIVNGTMTGVTFNLSKAIQMIGRAMDNDIVLEDAGVSRYHAEVRLRGSGFEIRDLRSTNGTRVNGREVTDAALADGDLISIAGADLVFRLA